MIVLDDVLVIVIVFVVVDIVWIRVAFVQHMLESGIVRPRSDDDRSNVLLVVDTDRFLATRGFVDFCADHQRWPSLVVIVRHLCLAACNSADFSGKTIFTMAARIQIRWRRLVWMIVRVDVVRVEVLFEWIRCCGDRQVLVVCRLCGSGLADRRLEW